jgi:hypothetical protein
MGLEIPPSVLVTSAWNVPAWTACWVARSRSSAPDCARVRLVLGRGVAPTVTEAAVAVAGGIAGVAGQAGAASGPWDDDEPHPASARTVIAAIGPSRAHVVVSTEVAKL